MLFHMPYIFDAVVVDKRCRHASHGYFGDRHPVEIEEVSGSEAPVAMRWDVRKGDCDPFTCETRWFDNRHWIAFGSHEDPSPHKPLATEMEIENPYHYVAAVLRYDYHRLEALKGFLQGKLPGFNPDDVREVHMVDRESGVLGAERAAGRLLIVDGYLHVPSHEPCYELSIRDRLVGGEQRPSAWIAVDLHRNNQRSPFERPRFRADRPQDLRDYFRERFPRHAMRSSDRIEVLLPQSVNFEDDRHAVVHTARRVIGSFSHAEDKQSGFEMLREMRAEDAVQWFLLRDALAADGGGEEAAMAIAARLGDLSRGMPESRLREEANDAIRRWEMRPVTDLAIGMSR